MTCHVKKGDVPSRRHGHSCGAKILGTGTVELGNLFMSDVVHVHGLKTPLISEGQVCDQAVDDETQGKLVIFSRKGAAVIKMDQVEIPEDLMEQYIPRDANGLYSLQHSSSAKVKANVAKSTRSLWHRRLVHVGKKVYRCWPRKISLAMWKLSHLSMGMWSCLRAIHV